jgi:FtsH-binding integral membrane protein
MSLYQNFIVSLFLLFFLSIFIFYARCQSLTPSKYITINYSYIALAFLLITIFSFYFLFKKYHLSSNFVLILSFVMSLICMFLVYSVQNDFVKHIFWIFFLFTMAVIMYPLFLKTYFDGTYFKSLIALVLILIFLTIIVHIRGPEAFSSWGKILFYLLLCLIVIELIDLIFSNENWKRLKIYGWAIIILFSFFLMYDTSVLLKESKRITGYVDYPARSMSLFLDLINLFSGMTGVSN